MVLRTETLYTVYDEVTERVSYAVTPDGEGCYWYDTEEEAEEALPEVYSLVNVTADNFDKLRWGI